MGTAIVQTLFARAGHGSTGVKHGRAAAGRLCQFRRRVTKGHG
jgi:hypothetical protein